MDVLYHNYLRLKFKLYMMSITVKSKVDKFDLREVKINLSELFDKLFKKEKIENIEDNWIIINTRKK